MVRAQEVACSFRACFFLVERVDGACNSLRRPALDGAGTPGSVQQVSFCHHSASARPPPPPRPRRPLLRKESGGLRAGAQPGPGLRAAESWARALDLGAVDSWVGSDSVRRLLCALCMLSRILGLSPLNASVSPPVPHAAKCPLGTQSSLFEDCPGTWIFQC